MPKQVNHDEKRTEIIDAALRLVVRSGLESASIRNIAAEAGCSVRPVQYYFADKATLLAAAHARVTQLLGANIATAVGGLGPDADPRAIVETVVQSFLPTTDRARDAMIAYYAFYAAELVEPRVRIKGAKAAPNRIAELIESNLRRFHNDKPPFDPTLEAHMLVMAIPSIASGVIAGYTTLPEARRLLSATLSRLMP